MIFTKQSILFFSVLAVFVPSILLATNPYVANVNGHVANNIVVQNKRVEFDARYFQGVNGYYSLGSNLVEKRLEQEALEQNERLQRIVDENNKLQGQLELLIKILAERQDTPVEVVPPTPEPNVPDDPAPPASPEPTADDSGDSPYVPTELDKQVHEIFVKSCAKCHNPIKENGIVLINTENNSLKLLDLVDRVEVYDRTFGVGLEDRGKARMPKGGNLTNEEVETLRLWMIEESDRLR